MKGLYLYLYLYRRGGGGGYYYFTLQAVSLSVSYEERPGPRTTVTSTAWLHQIYTHICTDVCVSGGINGWLHQIPRVLTRRIRTGKPSTPRTSYHARNSRGLGSWA